MREFRGRLKRERDLSAATGPQWGLSWTYDGFGNRLAQNVTKGTAPVVSLSVSAATNRITTPGFAYDAAGNLVQWPGGTVTIGAEYEVDGRLSMVRWDGVERERYFYDARNLRVKRGFYYQVYGLSGELLGEYQASAGSVVPQMWRERVCFAGRLVATMEQDGTTPEANTERLGSIRVARRFPFGEGNNADNDEFATYRKDTSTQHDYAWHRYYSATWGRFSSPDPYVMSGGLTNPQGWNRYSYVANDPVNWTDRSGLWMERPSFCDFYPDEWYCSPYPASSETRTAGRESATGKGGSYEQPRGGHETERETSYEKAVWIAKHAAEAISKKTKWKKDCQELLGSLGTNGAAIAQAAGRVEFLQGPGNSALWSSLYANHPRLGPAAAAEHPNMTIGEFFAEQPNTKAMGELFGNKVYLNPKWWGKGYYDDMATVMHELIHNVTGLTDSDISRMLGEKPISDFSSMLRDKCL